MDRFKVVEKNDERLYKLKEFIIYLIAYLILKNMKSDEFYVIFEILLNFLNNNIKTDVKSYIFLERLRESLHVYQKRIDLIFPNVSY